MAITIKDIAKLAGVSIGTVDRALHNRGRVRPELAQQIKNIATEHGFKPSQAGRALTLAKKPMKIGAVVHLAEVAFMQQALAGIEQAQQELANLGAQILIEKIPYIDAQAQLSAIEGLVAANIDALVISPAVDAQVAERLHSLSQSMPVLTFNTDVAPESRHCFVGIDNAKSGRMAASLMGKMLPRTGHIAIISGNPENQACQARIEGFGAYLATHHPMLQVVDIQYSHDSVTQTRAITQGLLAGYPELSGIFMCSGGQLGCVEAIAEGGKAGTLKLIAYDMVPGTLAGLRQQIIDFAIDQDPYQQGYRPIMLAYDHLFHGQPLTQGSVYTDINIWIPESLSHDA